MVANICSFQNLNDQASTLKVWYAAAAKTSQEGDVLQHSEDYVTILVGAITPYCNLDCSHIANGRRTMATSASDEALLACHSLSITSSLHAFTRLALRL